jgi:hypothetical protein
MAAPTALNMRCSLGSAASLSCRRSAKCTRRAAAVAPLAAVREIFMPALSSTMTEGKIVSWLKSEGDKARALGPHQHCLLAARGRPGPLYALARAWLRLSVCPSPRGCAV